MNTPVDELIRVPVFNGELSGGEALVIESFHDLAALQGFCATAPSIGTLWENLRFRELRVRFPSLRKEWAAHRGEYRRALQDRIGETELDDLDSLIQLRLALDLAEGIWAQEDPGDSGERSALALVLAVAVPGGRLEFTCEEPVLLFSSGSPFSFLLLPGVFQTTEMGVWLVGLCRNVTREEGLASRSIAKNLVQDLRERRAKEIPAAERDLLLLTRLESKMTVSEDLATKQGTVIFLHGLLSTDLGTFDGFIRELYAGYPELCRRVLLVGWPHDTLASIESNAHELYQLIDRTLGPSGRNIIMVCHSRGGLVARAAALRLYKFDEKYRRMLKGCVTFGTPHEGAEPANVDADRFLAYFVATTTASGNAVGQRVGNFVARASDMLTYKKQQTGKVIHGINDLRTPDGGGFIAKLQDDELNDAGKERGRDRSLRLFTVGGRYHGPHNAWSRFARKFFGKNVEHDLVVGVYSSAPEWADIAATVDCSHSAYCSEPLRSSLGMQGAVKQAVEWLKEPGVSNA